MPSPSLLSLLLALLLLLLLVLSPPRILAQDSNYPFDFNQNSYGHLWKAREPIPLVATGQQGLSDFTGNAQGRFIYVYGGCMRDMYPVQRDWGLEYECGAGYVQDAISNILLSYDPAANTWSRLADGPSRRYRHASALLDGKLYVYGGLNTDGGVEQLVTKLDIYDIATDTWTTAAGDFPGAMPDMSGFTVNGKVYAVGGYNYPSYVASNLTWIYTPSSNAWQLLPDKMNFARGDTQAAVTSDGRVFVFGGYTDLDGFAQPYGTFEILKPDGITWERTTENQLPSEARGDAGMAIINDRIYIMGGEFKKSGVSEPTDSVEYYNYVAESVRTGGAFHYAGELPTPRFRLVTVSFGESIIVMGGQGYLKNGSAYDLNSYYPVLRTVEEFRTFQSTEDPDAFVLHCHGIGPLDASGWILETIFLLKMRSRFQTEMTYRTLTSSDLIAEEFVARDDDYQPPNDFHLINQPLPADRYAELKEEGHEIIQFPVGISAIAIVYNLPAMETGEQLVLDACLLLDIYTGSITSWDHPELLAKNPFLSRNPNLPLYPIRNLDGSPLNYWFVRYLNSKVASCGGTNGTRRALASSAITTEYFNLSIPPYARATMDEDIYWNAGFIGFTVSSPTMKSQEAYLVNKAGTVLSTQTADVLGSLSNVSFPADPTSDFSGFSLLDLDGQKSWPLVVVSFGLMRTDLTAMLGHTASWTKAFFSYLITPEVQQLTSAGNSGKIEIPDSWKAYTMAALAKLKLPFDDTAEFDLHSDDADLFSLPTTRVSFEKVHLDFIDSALADLSTQVTKLSGVVGDVHDPLKSTIDELNQTNQIAIAALIISIFAFLIAFYAAFIKRPPPPMNHSRESIDEGWRASSKGAGATMPQTTRGREPGGTEGMDSITVV